MQKNINMIFRKHLLNSELLLIATIITLSIANNTEYEKIANKTEYDTEYTSVNYTLPVVPLHYNGEIRFFFEDNIVFGQCSIIINISQPLKSITMHSVPVSIMDAILIDGKTETVYKLFNSSFNKEKNILTLNFDKLLLHNIFPSTFTLKITYMRIIHENGKLGFFTRSVHQEKLKDEMLNETGVAVMKVRQLFPCRDELTINSTFKIAIKHEEKYTILSNIPIRARNKADNGMMWTDFDESLPMSAQHISVVITTFTNVSSQLANVTIWCRQSARNHVLYAKNVIEQVLPYFKQGYLRELSKLDIVAFWHHRDYNIATLRLVLLREADIIYNETLHPVIRQREVAHIIARQLIFLWCDDALLWSKEGFAVFFGTYILDQIYQNNHMMDLMVVQAQQDSLRYNIPTTIHSPTLNSTDTSEGNSLRPPQNYMKSFIIWRMLYHVIPDMFWRGIRTYIDSRPIYSNMRTPDDLWTTLQTIYNETYPNHMLSFHLKEIIISWITKEYYPILNISRHYWNLTLVIGHIQSPYLLVNDKTLIWIPVTLTTQSSLNFDKTDDSLFWLTSQNSEHSILGVGKSNWFIINIQQAGYYRVKYDFENWQKLMRYLNSEDYRKIHILNRAQIIDDAFYFFLQRELSYNVFWNLTSFVLRDTNFVTWYPMFKAFEFMTCIFPFQFSFHALYSILTLEKMKDRIEQLLAEIGYFEEPADHTLTIYLREEAVKWACVLGVSQCRRIAASELNKELENSVENYNLVGKEWTYCHGLTTANQSIWYKILQKWNATSDERFLEYLTCSKNSTILCHFLEKTGSEESRSNESIRINKPANIFLLIVAKHAQRDAVHSCLFSIIKNVTLSSNRRNDIIAILIVVITHVHKEDHMIEIFKFATRVVKEKQLVGGIQEKLKKRRLEYRRLIQNYGYYFS